eukprot:scaffold970_cov412-Prasinococcus_capsulatus_cf.AAC.11
MAVQDGETSDAAPDATWHFDAQTWQTTEVTVYSALGEVTRRHSLDSLPAGLHRVVVYNLTTSLVLGRLDRLTARGEEPGGAGHRRTFVSGIRSTSVPQRLYILRSPLKGHSKR